jgi:ribose transport system substrate-binding protein
MNRKALLLLVIVSVLAAGAIVPSAAQDNTGPFKVGISNSFVSSEWRTQMIDDIEAVVEEYAEQGVEVELIIESEDTDAQGQIQQIQNLIDQDVDAIVINPGDVSALALTLEEAAAEGIVIVSVDQEIEGEGILNVVIDQTEWARISTRWVAEQMGGAGDLVLIEGFVGHPANEARMAGVEEVLAEYPDINVVGRESGMWDQATGQQVMSDFLASLPNIDAVWTQDGMAQGALTAVQTANPDEWPLVVGEARAGYLQLWNAIEAENPDFTSIGVVNPPVIGAAGLRVAIEVLMGNEVDEEQLTGPFGNSLHVPIPGVIVDNDFTYTDADGEEVTITANFADEFAAVEELPEAYTVDGIVTQEDAHSFMVQE